MVSRSVLSTWAAYNKNDTIRYNSSSGGIFSLIAEAVIHAGGVVYGVAMDDDCYGCSYKRVTTIEGLAALRGSKYLQAKVGDTYKQVRSDLQNGMPVLFSGVGCQINGLNCFLNKHYDNLLCVDVICHGTPSPKIWNMYIKDIEKEHGKVKSVSFRNKQNSWEDFRMKEEADDASLFYSKDNDTYMRFFLRNYDLRPSCYNCRAKTYKTSDITLADFWGINAVDPSMNDSHGTSLILVRTEKGKEMLDQIRDQLVLKPVSYEEGVRSNPSEYSSVAKPEQRNTLFEDAAVLSYQELVKKYKIDQVPKASFKHRVKMKVKSVAKRILNPGGEDEERKPELNYGMFLNLKMERAIIRNQEYNNTDHPVPVLFEKKEDCCGCTACYAICPKQAIRMIEDEEGFLYPSIDAKECIRCGSCIRVCPIKAADKTNK